MRDPRKSLSGRERRGGILDSLSLCLSKEAAQSAAAPCPMMVVGDT
ncbi:MAG: hypothetical protein QMC89_06225 [Candidatus Hodarchaeaceae archaeon]|nr:hypothetical protein [Candidatus Hodarchaeaceae archaeon]